MVQCAYVELALAKGNLEVAFALIEQLTLSDLNRSEEQNGLRVLQLRSEVLIGLGRFTEAEASLKAAQHSITLQGVNMEATGTLTILLSHSSRPPP